MSGNYLSQSVEKNFISQYSDVTENHFFTIGHHLKLPLEIGLIQITPHAQNCKSNIFSIYQTESSMRYSDIVSLYIYRSYVSRSHLSIKIFQFKSRGDNENTKNFGIRI